MTTVAPVFISICANHPHNLPFRKQIYSLCLNRPPRIKFDPLRAIKFGEFHQKMARFWGFGEIEFFLGLREGKDGILVREEKSSKRRVVLASFSRGFGFNGGGGGRRDEGTTARLLGNLALAAGLTYLSVTGQLGWLLDAIVSLWLLAVLVPIVGLGAFLWWAGRDMIQGTCPNCGNSFQIFKSSLNDELQLCPFCSQPFSVVGNEFISDPVKFSNRSTAFGETFDDFSPKRKKGKNTSTAVVDVEAEIKDAD
ncbi:hypothetical protein Nepgr_016237 [Nepenthes gracilis]|uniref:Uncharacterized protein n=1 Tax=Nepenthes gracilis TaxID=150966 RepID=A0AAD3SPY4_NEPGR|nr:hypothetical protein Nepgr_016237 [Nepenthes gracilis]